MSFAIGSEVLLVFEKGQSVTCYQGKKDRFISRLRNALSKLKRQHRHSQSATFNVYAKIDRSMIACDAIDSNVKRYVADYCHSKITSKSSIFPGKAVLQLPQQKAFWLFIDRIYIRTLSKLGFVAFWDYFGRCSI